MPDTQLNYPSFSVVLHSTPQTFTRTTTNVGKAKSIYIVKVFQPEGVSVNVSPNKLIFTQLNQKQTYSVAFIRANSSVNSGEHFTQGYLRWVSKNYSIRSPISITFKGVNG
jgi:hypothetical protein